MKQKYFYSILLLFLGLFGFSQTLDQENAPADLGGGSFTVSPSQDVGQSFTAGMTGDLSQINIRVGNWGSIFIAGDFQLRIIDGNGYSGTVLNTTTFSIPSAPATSNYDELAIVLSATVSITSGNMYTIDLKGITGTVSTHGANPGYANGGLYFANGNNALYNGYDLWFKTFVNIPTPATHLNFDGVNDHVNLGTSLATALNGTTALTLEAWINPSVLNGWNNIITDYNGSYHKLLLRVRNNNNIQFWLNGTVLNSSFTVPLDTWTHIAAVYDGSNMYVYANGVLVASQPATVSLPTTTDQFNIGSRIGSNTENFTGSIDEVRVWTTARTPEQINGSMNCELQGNETGLLAYYNFNQGIDQANNSSETTLIDITSNGYNGTLTNFALTGASSNWLAGSPVTTGSIVPGNASASSPINYYQGDTASALTATAGTNGTGLLWYTTATSGTGSTTAPTPSTATIGSTSYWVSSTNANGCESERVEIVVNVSVVNDECSNSITLTVGSSSFNDFPENINLTGATNSGAPAPTCGDFQGGDVWYTVTIPASGNVIIETDGIGAYDTGLEVYTGSCGTFSLVACDDNSGNGNYSKILLLGQTPGTVLYVRTWENFWGNSNAQFQISAYDYVVPATHLNFDGTNDFVISANSITNNTQNQTYQAWFRIPSLPANNDRILQRGSDGTGGWSVQMDVTSTGKLSAGISASPDTYLTGTTTLIPNTWYHATFVFENNNSLRLYLNGTLEASVTIGNRTLRNSDNRLRVGSGNIASEYFNGDIDDVRVWNMALSQTDIVNTMNCELDNSETNLVAYYKFNQGFDYANNSSVLTANDSSGNNNNGTLNNFTLTGPLSNWASGSIITTGNTCSVVLDSESFKLNNISLYPNPTNGIVNIRSNTKLTIEIYDLLGKVILTTETSSGIENLNITNYPSGIYLIKTTNEQGYSKTFKVIKK